MNFTMFNSFTFLKVKKRFQAIYSKLNQKVYLAQKSKKAESTGKINLFEGKYPEMTLWTCIIHG